MQKFKFLIEIIKKHLKGKVVKILLLKVSSKFAGPIGFIAGFLFDYGWKYMDKALVYLAKKTKILFKKADRRIDKKKIERADNAEKLKSAVDDFLN